MRALASIQQPIGDAHPMLQGLVQARELLAESRSIDWCKTLRDQAEAMRVYARQQQLGRDAQVYAAEIKVRAERRIGELTATLPTAPGTRTDVTTSPDHRARLSDAQTKKDVLDEAGVTTKRASEYERLAALSEETFETKLREAAETGKPASTDSLIRLVPSEPKVYHPSPPSTAEDSFTLPGKCPHCNESLAVEVHMNWAMRWVRAHFAELEHEGQDWDPSDDD